MNTNITTKKRWAVATIAVVLVAILSVSLVACGATKSFETPNGEVTAEEASVNDFTTKIQNTEFVNLAMSEAVTSSTTNSISKTLTATITPATATNKFVDWSVEWGDESNETDVSEYITVTPSSDGSTVATVTCYKLFTGNIIITVTTRQNGYQASCVVSYLGMPSDIVINTTVVQENGDYVVGIGVDSQFDVSLTNSLGAVGSQFNDVTCEVNGVGSIVVGYMEHYNASGNDSWLYSVDETITIDSIKDALISVSYSSGKLTVTSIRSIESYYGWTTKLDSGRTTAYHNKFRSFVDDCYFQVTIHENTSGLSKIINIRFSDEFVTGVSISSSEIVF